MTKPRSWQSEVQAAIQHFWVTRLGQSQRQGVSDLLAKDRGSRAHVTGGKQLDGFVSLIVNILVSSGIDRSSIELAHRRVILPGYFRPTKQWDLLVLANGKLLAAMELKSQFGSLGNNSNNRAEEAIGSAHDFWTAYREGAFADSPRPWLGYLFLLEESLRSQTVVKSESPHFPVLTEFVGSSYVDRYAILCRKLVRERLYDAATLLITSPNASAAGVYREPEPEASFDRMARSLIGHLNANFD